MRVCPGLFVLILGCFCLLSLTEEIVCIVTGEGDDNLLCRRTKREAHVVFAPHFPSLYCVYVIIGQGVLGVQGQTETLQKVH